MRSDEWITPRPLFHRLNREFRFTLDAAATSRTARVRPYISRYSLTRPWRGRVWCNPPYSDGVEAWVRKAAASVREGAEVVVVLVPVDTSTKWWHEVVMRRASEVRFVRGRLSFTNPWHPKSDRSASAHAVVVFRRRRRGGWFTIGTDGRPR